MLLSCSIQINDMEDGRVKLVVRMDEDRAGQAQNVYGKAMKKMRSLAKR